MKAILGDEILVSHDRWCFYRPAGCETPTRQNLHLDLHPWRLLTAFSMLFNGFQWFFPSFVHRSRFKRGRNG